MIICQQFTDGCPDWLDTEVQKLPLLFDTFSEGLSATPLYSPQDEDTWNG